MSETDNESHNGDDSLRPRKRSLVWQFFEKLSRYRVRCRLCAHEQNYQGTTGNILRHLKSKHELDATIKGQQDPHHQERLRLLLSNVSAYSSSNSNNNTNTFSTMDIKVERKYKPRKRSHNDMMTQEDDDNPFVDDGGHNNSTTYIQEEPFENYLCSDEQPVRDPVSEDEWGAPNPPTPVRRKARSQLDDERVVAETEYFREKAAYFKLQKHLTALQAKKIRIEIEQLTKRNNLV